MTPWTNPLPKLSSVAAVLSENESFLAPHLLTLNPISSPSISTLFITLIMHRAASRCKSAAHKSSACHVLYSSHSTTLKLGQKVLQPKFEPLPKFNPQKKVSPISVYRGAGDMPTVHGVSNRCEIGRLSLQNFDLRGLKIAKVDPKPKNFTPAPAVPHYIVWFCYVEVIYIPKA